jgi:antitoxin PrlF
MSGVRVKVGSKGRFVIPAEYRKALGVEEGDELLVRFVDGEVRIGMPSSAIKRAQEMVRRYVPKGHSLVDELLGERRSEAQT